MANTKISRNSLASMAAFAAVSALVVLVLFAIISPMTSYATVTNTVNALTGCLIVPGTCTPSFTNTVIYFSNAQTVGYVQPGSYAATQNDVNVVNLGNYNGNIAVSAFSGSPATGNWISTAGSFLVGNTLWSLTSGQNIGTQLTNTVSGVDTKIPVKANSGTNDIFFGLNVPTGQAAGSYNQVITVFLSC